ncbi:hypothetical protein [Nonomuraea salmonea]|uniref:hypothetical protein n=1 Tax=Nonomuraea salmonea TaxID=46181 RepID=UPI0031EF35EC
MTRDRLMVALDERYPHYGFAEHKGYVTPGHRLALETHGPCPDHRYSFVTVARGGWVRMKWGGRGCLSRHTGGPVRQEDRDERRGSRKVRNRDGAAALPRIPRCRRFVHIRGGD